MRGKPRKIFDAVEGWRSMLSELLERYPSRRAVVEALRPYGAVPSSSLLKQFMATGEIQLSHKSQRAIASLYESHQGATH